MLKRLKKQIKGEDFDLLEAESSVKNLPLSKQIIAGSVAGLCEHLTIFPIDTIKVLLETA
jgi:hypothetical protein